MSSENTEKRLFESLRDGYLEMYDLNLRIAREGFHLECEVERIYSHKFQYEHNMKIEKRW